MAATLVWKQAEIKVIIFSLFNILSDSRRKVRKFVVVVIPYRPSLIHQVA